MKKTRSKIIIALAAVLLAAAAALGITAALKKKPLSADAATYTVSSYSDLVSYVEKYSATSSSGQNTIKLGANLTATSTIKIESGSYITIDLNGYNIALGSTTTKAFNVYGNLTLKDSSESYTKSTKQSSLGSSSLTSSSNKYTKTFYVTETDGTYTKYTYTAGSIYGSSSTSTYGSICVYNGGTLDMYGGIIHSGSNDYGAGIYLYGNSSSAATLNMYGGIICDNSASYAGAIYSAYGTMNFVGGAIADNTVTGNGSAVLTKTDTTNSYRFGLNGETGTGSKFDRMIVCGNSAKYGTVWSNSNSTSSGVPFYMYDGAIFSGNTVSNSGAVVYSRGDVYFYGGEVTGNYAQYGNFFVEDGYSMTMTGGTVAYNTGVEKGACFYGFVNNDITMSGGTIENNSGNYGAAGYLKSGCSFKMTGGTIQNNTVSTNGGAFYLTGAEIEVTGGTITGNYAKYGGAFYLADGSKLTASAGTVTDNAATTRGGAVCVSSSSGSASITGGTWTRNLCDGSSSYGGTIYNTGGDVTLSGITISGSSASYGGAIYAKDGSMTVKATTIQDNKATTDYGGGIYFYGGSLTLSGKVIIQGNYKKSATLQNVYIASGLYITLGGALSSGSDIGVTLASSSQTQITTAESSTSYYSAATKYFSLDTGNDIYFITSQTGKYVERMEIEGNVSVKVTMQDGTVAYYDSLGDAVSAAATKSASTYGTAQLLSDVEVSSTISVAEGYYVGLDLNGCTATWTGSSKTDFFTVYGYMALTDSTAEGGAYGGTDEGVTAVAGTNGTQYRTVYPVMFDDGDTYYYYYQSGALTGGQSDYGSSNSNTNSRGGAIYVGSAGTLDMFGGTLTGNTATYGGGVCSLGTFNMYGGSISANSAVNTSTKHNGGGVFIESGSSAGMYGGVLYANTGVGKGFGGGMENRGMLVLDKLPSSDENSKYDFAGLGIVISSNVSDVNGGAIDMYSDGTLVMNDGYLTLNTAAAGYGGAICTEGPVTINGGYITGNYAGKYAGGGVHITGSFTMCGGVVAYNTATTTGGGVNATSTVEISGGTISHNIAGTEGGGLNSSGKTAISGGEFSYNETSSSSGGGLALYGNTVIDDILVTGNVAGGSNYGGGINVGGGVTLTVNGGYILYNKACYGAGVHTGDKGTTLILNGGYICCNTSTSRGGGLYLGNSGTVFYMYGGEISGNTAGDNGGGIFVNTSCAAYFYGGEITENVTSSLGGGIYINTSVALTIGGDFKVYGNTEKPDDSEGTPDNIYLTSGKVIEIEKDFEGEIHILNEANLAVRISSSTFTRDEFLAVKERIFADSKEVNCIGLNSSDYISFFSSHNWEMEVYQTEKGIVTVEYCSQCYDYTYHWAGEENDSFTYVYSVSDDGTVYVTVTDAENGNTASIALEVGVTVETSDGTLTWYPDLGLALAATENVEDDVTVTLYEDYTDGTGEGITLSGKVTLDLNDNTIDSKITVSEGSTLTITDTAGGGEVTGSVSVAEDAASGSVSLTGGTYHGENILDFVENGYYPVYVGKDGDGNPVYTVYSEEEIGEHSAAYIENADGTRIYYETVSEAIEAAEGETIHLSSDVAKEDTIAIEAGENITIDLNGHTLDATITINAGAGNGGSLTVVDSSADGDGATGLLTGTITVSGTSTDTEGTNSYEGTLSVPASAVSAGLDVEVEVKISVEGESTVSYSFGVTETDGDGNATSYGIVTGHTCVYNIPDFYIDADGQLCCYLRCSCGKYLMASEDVNAEKVSFVVPTCAYTVEKNGDGTVTYVVESFPAVADGGGTYTVNAGQWTIEPAVQINTYDGEGKLTGTIYLEEDNLEKISCILADLAGDGSNSAVEIVLWTDVEADISLASGNYTIDLNGNSLSGSITVGDVEECCESVEKDTSLTITDSASTASGGTLDGTGSAVESTITVNCDANLSVTGGTYSSDMSGYIDESATDMVIVYSDDGSTFTFVSETVAEGGAVAKIVDNDGNVVGYYTSLEAAINAASCGDTITLLNDTDESVVLNSADTTVTIDLNGCTIYGGVSAENGKIYITDSGNGTVTGEISGDVEISGGSYLCDVGGYLADGKALYAAMDEDGNLVYTVVGDASEGAVVAVTKSDPEGNEYTIYYDSLDDAVAALEDGCKLTLLKDIGAEDDPVSIVLDNLGEVTIDLNGNAIYGDIEAAEGTSLKITDTSDGKTGSVVGAVTGDGDIKTVAGTYSQSVADYLGDGGAMYVYTDSEGNTTYKVLSGGDVPPTGAVVSVTYENASGDTVTVYYNSLKAALSDLKDGSEITLLADVGEKDAEYVMNLLTESDTEINVTLDLNGHTVDGDITAGNNVNLTIVDSSAAGTGAVTGGVSADGSGSVEIDGGTYGNDVSEYVDVKGDSVVYVTTDADTGETLYSIVSAVDINAAGGCKAVASVTYTDADGKNVTLYFEAIEDAVKYACGKSEGGAENVTITLLGDATASGGLNFTSGDVTLDLNGKTLTIGGSDTNLSVDAGASLTMVGNGTVEGKIYIKESEEGSGSLEIYGGKYSDDISDYVAEGYVALYDDDGYYHVVTEEEALESGAAVKVVSDGGTVTYYTDITAAMTALEYGDTVTLLSDITLDEEDSLSFDKPSVTLDLNGFTIEGGISVTAGSLDITDSVGTGSVTGTVEVVSGSDAELCIYGGTYNDETETYLADYIDKGCVTVEGGDGTYTVVNGGSVADVAEAVVTDEDGNVVGYYVSVADAIAAAKNTGYTVVLLSDAEADKISITGSVAIDLNGHTLDADITISADEGGTLLVTDTAGGGSLTGTVSVVGEEDYSGDENPYADAFVMDGVRPGADLTVDLSELGSDDSDYSFGEILDGSGKSKDPAEYGIVTEHKHRFNIEVWTVGADGTITLSYVCACGEYLTDEAGAIVVYDADVTITYYEDAGTCVFEATVYLPDGTEATYTVEKTVAAIVEADGVTYYAESLEEAAGIAARADSATITLVADCEEDVTFKGEVTIDLNGHDIVGTVTVDDGAYVVVEGDGYVDSLEVGDSVVKLRGGTYGGESAGTVTDYTDYSSGYTTHVNSDGTVTVTDANTAAIGAVASVTDENGVTTYYEDLSAAVDAANELGCCTLTLCDDVDVNTTIEITSDGVTIDLNDHDVNGRVEIADGASATICGDGYVDTVKVAEGGDLTIEGGTYDDAETLADYMDTDDCAVLVNADGTYTVIGSEDADEYSTIAAVVHATDAEGNAYDVYFENVQAAAGFASENDAVVELTKDYGGNITVDTGSVTIDLSGYELSGNVSVGANAIVTIEDSVGGGFVEGSLNADGELKVTGGTFADETVDNYAAEGYVVVTNPADENGDVTYTVVNAENVESYAAAYVDYGNGTKEYFASLEDALEAALESGGTLGLLDDAEISGLELATGLTVDLNGHTLDIEVGIVAVDNNGEAAGSLTICDSSEGKGSVTGTIVVTDASEGWTDTSEEIYAESFVLAGVAPGADLTTNFEELYTEPGEEEEYVLGMKEDGTYGIIPSSTHECSFDIEIWTFNENGSVTLKLMCACGNYKTVIGADGNETVFEATTTDVKITENGDGTVTVTATVETSEGTYTCDMVVPVAACVETEDGVMYFESFEDALAYACESGGTLVLNGDVDFAEINIGEGCGIVIDLNGHDMECSVEVGEGSTLTFVDSSEDGSGTLSAALDIDGTLALDGVSFTLTESTDEDMTGGIVIGGGTTIDLGGNTLTNVVGIGENVTLTGGEGSAIVLGSDVTAGGGITVNGDVTLDLDGKNLDTEDGGTIITVESGAYLTIADSVGAGSGEIIGGVIVESGGGLDVYEGTYLGEDFEVTIDTDNYVLQALTDEYGDLYYEVVSRDEHERQGHGYDSLVDVSFDPWSCELTLAFECFCGDTVTRTVHVSESEYKTEMTEEGITVHVTKESTLTAENGSVYSYSVDETFIVEMTLNDDGEMVYVGGGDAGGTVDGWITETYVYANCTSTGTDKYIYGDGNGIAVYVETPLTHTGPVTELTTNDGTYTYYYCDACGKYFTKDNPENGYASEDALLADLGYSADYTDRKGEALEALEQAYNDAIAYLEENFTEDTTGYDDALASVVATYSVLYDEILSMDYEAQTEAESGDAVKTYYEELIAGLGAAISSAEIELQKKASEELLSAAFSDAYAAMEEVDLYDADVFYGMGVDFDALVSEFDAGDYSSVEDVIVAYEEFLEKVKELVSSAKANADARAEAKAKTDARTGSLYTGEDASVSGYVESSKGIDGGIELVITKLGTYGYSLGEGSLVYVGEGDLSDGEISALVDGKDIVAVYDVALIYTDTFARVYVFEGTYTVRIAVPDSILSKSGLQIVFVGDDGTVEVCDTVMTEEGYLQFTTTHFSTFLVLADEEVKDLNRLINVLFIIDCILAALAVVLALIFAARRRRMRRELDYLEGRKGTRTVASVGAAALLLVIPSYGVGAAVVLGIIGIALLVLDIFIIDRIFEKTAGTPLVFVDTRKDEYPYSFVYDSSDASAKKSEGTGKSENGTSDGSRLS